MDEPNEIEAKHFSCLIDCHSYKSFQLNVINERLKKRLKRMKKENVRVAKELTDIKAKLAVDNMMKQYVTTRR